jgi:integrase/recombinase XerD
MSKPNQGNTTVKKFDSALLDEYLRFLTAHRGLAKSTIDIRANYVAPFLAELNLCKTPTGLDGISAGNVHDYVIRTSRSMTRPSRKHLVSSLRSFLRFAHVRGYTGRNLMEAVPVIHTHKLDRIPRRIPWGSVEKLLAATRRDTHSGRRAYAVLQLLATYGVRIGQVTTLKIRDIDWHQHLIRFASSKKGRDLCLPLTHEVAEALLEYLRETRGNAPFSEVFLTIRGVPRPLSEHNHLYTFLDVYYRRAGIDSKIRGSHAIRHAFATRLMEQDVPIKIIADLLGHKCIQTTSIYTKVDLEHLRGVAQEWPEVEL